MAEKEQESNRRFRFTVPPNTSSPVVIKTQPNSVCTVRLDQNDEQCRELKVHASPEGFIRLHLTPLAPFQEPLKFVIDCEHERKNTQYPLEICSSFEPTREMPAPVDDYATVPSGSIVLPGLSDRDLRRFTDKQLFHKHYPLRPSQTKAPRLFEKWRKTVTRPGHFVSPYRVPVPLRSGPPPGSTAKVDPIWSGFATNKSVDSNTRPPSLRPFDYVTGMWNVPFAWGEGYYSLWVALGDEDSSYLAQAGIMCQVIQFSLFGIPIMGVADYFAFSEVLPQEPASVAITNFPVAPGDRISLEALIGDEQGLINLSGGNAYFTLVNHRAYDLWTVVKTPLQTKVTGNEVDWIMERPTIFYPPSGVFGPSYGPSPLANYGSAMMLFCYARVAGSPPGEGYVPYYGPTTIAITMANVGRVLSTATSLSPDAIRFDWENFN